MEILVYPWQSYNYTDVCAAFERTGSNVSYIDYHLDDYETDEVFFELGKKLLTDKHFDFVFSVNYFPVISKLCDKMNVPYVSWTCDNPLISMFDRSIFNPCNIIFTFDRTNYAQFRAMGVEHIYYLPLAVDVGRIDHLINNASDMALYKNDIAFVGSLYERNTYDRISPHLPEYLRGYLEAVICAQKLVSGGNIIESMLTDDVMLMIEDHFDLKKSEDSFSSLALVFSTTVLGFKVASEVRSEALTRLARRFKTSLYTNSRVMDLPKVALRGEADYFTQMPKVFHESSINLNFTIPNIVSGIPLRAFDILGCGGFLLSNYQAEYPLYFKCGVDLDCFESIDELTDKCDFYLKHEDTRKKIAESGYEKVKKYHNYDRRIHAMTAIISSLPDGDEPMLFMDYS